MKKIENDCRDCATPAYPCQGKFCPLRHVLHYYCDECEDEIDPSEVYLVEDKHLCEDCLKKKFKLKET